jgi:hypothetical protein
MKLFDTTGQWIAASVLVGLLIAMLLLVKC